MGVRLTDEELVQKAAMVIDDLTSGGLLNPEQTDRFIDQVIDVSTIAKEARVERMNAPKLEISKINFADRILRKAVEAQEPADTEKVKPSTSKVVLTTHEVLAAVDISLGVLEDNIEREALADRIMTMMTNRAAVDLEEYYLVADTAGTGGIYDDPLLAYLKDQDGWLKLANQHVYDHAAADFDPHKVFGKLIRMLPKKWLRNKREWRFYCHPDIEQAYRQTLSERATAAGDRYLFEDVPVLYQGIEVRGVHTWPTFEPEAGTITSPVLLAHPQNLIVGIQRQINIDRERKARKRVLELTLTLRVAVAVEEPDALAKAINVKHPA